MNKKIQNYEIWNSVVNKLQAVLNQGASMEYKEAKNILNVILAAKYSYKKFIRRGYYCRPINLDRDNLKIFDELMYILTYGQFHLFPEVLIALNDSQDWYVKQILWTNENSFRYKLNHYKDNIRSYQDWCSSNHTTVLTLYGSELALICSALVICIIVLIVEFIK